jgi:hypothetical protein
MYKGVFTEKFNWTPQELSGRVKEIDKICPEEGTTDLQTNDPRLDDNDNGNNPE